jgi:4-hydroxy-tetrahydrodipicolinate synthase
MSYTRAEAERWANEPFHGFFEAPFTPISDHLAINEEQPRGNIDRYIKVGADGLVVGELKRLGVV